MHTSLNFPDHVYASAKDAQRQRGFESFTAYVVEAVRRDLRELELRGIERRLAASHTRLERKVGDLKLANSATFTLTLAFARELLSLQLPDSRVNQILHRILSSARADVAGTPEPAIEEELIPDPEPNNDEEVPFGDYAD